MGYGSTQVRPIMNRLKNTRQKHDHSQQFVAEFTGLHSATIANIECNYYKTLCESTIVKLNKYFDKYENTIIKVEPKLESKDYNDLCDSKMKEMLRTTFINSYNKLLNPLGYEIVISIKPINP